MNTRYLIAWSLLDFLYLVAAGVCFVFALAWRGMGPADLGSPTMLMRRLVVSEKDSLAAIGLGAYIAATVAYSIFAILHTRRQETKTLQISIFSSMVVLAGLVTVAIGTAIWYFTLRERADFEAVWIAQSQPIQQFLQDSLQCCGYWNASTPGLFSANTGFCDNPQVAANATFATPCVTPLTKYADNTLNNIFSTVYGIVAVEGCLFLATLCIRQDKLEEERFRRIEEKKGVKGGFV